MQPYQPFIEVRGNVLQPPYKFLTKTTLVKNLPKLVSVGTAEYIKR